MFNQQLLLREYTVISLKKNSIQIKYSKAASHSTIYLKNFPENPAKWGEIQRAKNQICSHINPWALLWGWI